MMGIGKREWGMGSERAASPCRQLPAAALRGPRRKPHPATTSPVLRKVLECASPLALSAVGGIRKRQRAAAVQDAGATTATGCDQLHPEPRAACHGGKRVLIGADGFGVRNGTRHE